MDEHQVETKLFDTAQWLGWFGASAVTFVSVTAFAFTTFLTKAEYKDHHEEDRATSVRLEQKIDQLQQTLNQLLVGKRKE